MSALASGWSRNLSSGKPAWQHGMTRNEFLLVFAWLYVLPFVIACLALLIYGRYANGQFIWKRYVQATGLLAVLAIPVGIGMALAVPYWLLVRDWPVMWAPWMFMTLACVLPFACRWLTR